MWFDSAAAWAKTQRSRGTPSAVAVSAAISSTAPAWSTFHCEHSRFVYGVASMRLPGPGVPIASASYPVRSHASSLAAATAAKRAHSSATRACCSTGDRPAAWRDGALDQRVLVDRHREVALDLGPAEDLVHRHQQLVRVAGRRVPVVQRDPGPGGEHVPGLRLGPGDEHHVCVPGGDRGRGAREERLLEDAELGDDTAGVRRAHLARPPRGPGPGTARCPWARARGRCGRARRRSRSRRRPAGSPRA